MLLGIYSLSDGAMLCRYFKSEAFLTKSPTPSSRHSNSIPPIAADSARDCGLPITLQPLVASKNVLYYESDFIVEYITGPAQYRVDCSGGKQNAFQEVNLHFSLRSNSLQKNCYLITYLLSHSVVSMVLGAGK